MTHICISKLTITGSGNGLLFDRRQVIIWTNVKILFTGPLGTNLWEILIKILAFSFEKVHLNMASGKWRACCLGLNRANVRGAAGSGDLWLRLPLTTDNFLLHRRLVT